VTQWVQAKLDKLVTSLSQLPITTDIVLRWMYIRQLKQVRADKSLNSRHRVKLH